MQNMIISKAAVQNSRLSLNNTPPNRQVLLVDSDPLSTPFLQRLLQNAGYTVQCATSTATAWRQLERSAPALIVLNVSSIGGAFPWIACLKMDQATASLPIIAVADRQHMVNLLCAIDLAVADYLPIEDARTYLCASIEQVLVQTIAQAAHAWWSSKARALSDSQPTMWTPTYASCDCTGAPQLNEQDNSSRVVSWLSRYLGGLTAAWTRRLIPQLAQL